MLHTLSLAAAISAVWSGVAVLLAVPLSALFRAQERLDERWRQAERRRRWLDAAR